MKKLTLFLSCMLLLSSLWAQDNSIAKIQYYFDTFPMPGETDNGETITFPSAQLSLSESYNWAIPPGLSPGVHQLYVRVQNADQSWSLTESKSFYLASTPSSNLIEELEFYIDDDPGVGNGTPISVSGTPSSAVSETAVLDLPNDLTSGVHQLYIRARSEDEHWSLTESKAFYVTSIATSNLVEELEFYFDNDPGVGNGTPISISGAPSSAVSETVVLDLPNDLSTGVHQLYIRARSEDEHWSLTESKPFYVTSITSSNLVEELEFFIDDDPGVGNGTPISVSGTPSIVVSETVVLDLPNDLTTGVHQLYIRARSEDEHWSLTESKVFYVNEESGVEEIVAMEYFFDMDPGVGLANPISISTTLAVDGIYPIDVPCLSEGTHYLYIRAQDSGGDWSLFELDTLTTTEGVPAASVSPGGPLSLCPGNTIDLAIVPVAGVSYQWVKDGVDIPDETGDTLTVSAGGEYAVKSICSGSFIISTAVTVNESTLSTYYADSDNDGFGNPLDSLTDCTQPTGYVLDNTDCNDNDVNVNPNATEICNGIDDNCNLLIDGNDPNLSGGTAWYADNDGDGFGDASVVVSACNQPIGFVADNTDCDDNNMNVNPNGTESCNGVDDNCNLSIDEGVQNTYYADSDGDTFGNPLVTILACSAPTGYVADNTDCDDSDENVHPTANEICNGIDDNCNNLTDDDDPGLISPPTWFADIDEDGFGDPLNAVSQCTQPTGYLSDNSDCDDSDPNEFPGQLWYIDGDEDGYGTDATLVQCERPANGFLSSELTSTSGDCDDDDPAINPDSRYITYSSANPFTNSLIYPQTGSPYTEYTFEVTYFDASNILPSSTYPRVLLDFEGNGNFTNENDRVIIMTEADANDLVTSDGKTYIASIEALPAGTDWTSRIQLNDLGCIQEFGPFDYPDVLVSPDLEIYASDIVFSNNNPSVNSQLTVTATVHNVSDFDAQNFVVHLENQAEPVTSFPDQIVNNLAANSSTTVSWTITTPPTEGWNPMLVSIDHANNIEETNELNNVAIRPFVNGDYNVPGEIILTASPSPAVVLDIPGQVVNIQGNAEYVDTAIPLDDPSVAGALITITILETGATFTTVTNNAGYYSKSLISPLIIGTYSVLVEITDFTLENSVETSFEVVPAPCLPDLISTVNLSSTSIIAGESIDVSFTVENIGCQPVTQSTELTINQSGGVPILNNATTPPLAPEETDTINFTNLLFSDPGVYTICSTADGLFDVTEASENNNSDCAQLTVIPNLPNLKGKGTSESICFPDSLSSAIFTVSNTGAAPAGPSTALIYIRFNGSLIDSLINAIDSIQAFSSLQLSQNINFDQIGVYSFELIVDAENDVVESNENDNVSLHSSSIIECLPDLVIYNQCQFSELEVSVDPDFPDTATYSVVIHNFGDTTAFAPIKCEFLFSGGNSVIGTISNDIPPGGSEMVSVVAATVEPATQTLTAIADPSGHILEYSETNNSESGELCWEFSPTGQCGLNFWNVTYPINQPVSFSAGIRVSHLYRASSVNVRFAISGPGITGTVDIGDAVLSDAEETCGCPDVVTLDNAFAFPEPGTYTVTITADPDNNYTECDEENNVLVVNVEAIDTPDMRILSEYIAPSELNPDEDELIAIDITYENIGASNTADQMDLNVYVDEILLESTTVMGLLSGDNNTVSLTNTWSSDVVGAHVIRAEIDANGDVNVSNNEATRAIVVGAAGNLFFASLTASNPIPSLSEVISVNAVVENEGTVDIMADVVFFYLDDFQNEVQIGSPVPVSVPAGGTVDIEIPWAVQDPSTTIIARITNSEPTEYNYLDNEAETLIGAEPLTVTLDVTGECDGDQTATITASPEGGIAPYTYLWSNGATNQTLTAAAGTYTVTVEDAVGNVVMESSTISGEPTEPLTECWETATFNNTTCMWEVFGEQPIEPDTECWETATFDNVTCSWDVTGEQEPTPQTECWETATFNDVTCSWEVFGEQPLEPDTECWETATFDNVTCSWDVTGEQDPAPVTECWETAIFNDATCSWDVTGEQAPAPETECWETATFNDTSCMWEVFGEQPIEPDTECWESATFNNVTCSWDVTGEQEPTPQTECWETATFNNVTCSWDVTGEQDPAPQTECWETATFNDTTCMWEVSGEQPLEPVTECWETATFNDVTCSWEVTGEQDPAPVTECWETATFNDFTCSWEVFGEQPLEPDTECWETATFDNITCSWDVTGEQDPAPQTECWETATFNDTTCMWEVSGEQPLEPVTECWETATFNDVTCSWEVTGEQDPAPVTECWETATFNDFTCSWEVFGEQPLEPDTECWETATFDNITCSWDVTGEQDPAPQTECWETATFNHTTCMWEVFGEQPLEPDTECWETATFNNVTCSWFVTGEQDPAPQTECWETAIFNDTTCMWEVSGEQPIEPDTECWETATFNDITCSWEVFGEQPIAPDTECWETASFNNTTCSWDVTGEQEPEPVTECWETATFNTTTCLWEVSGEQPMEPDTECWETATFDNIACSWDVTGEQEPEPVSECWETATFNNTTCLWEVFGEQPIAPDTECWETASFNNTTCSWDVTGEQDPAPVTECWETAIFNDVTCSWDVTGEQAPAPETECWETAAFNDETCMWEVFGEQPIEPNTECWETATFNNVTCSWEVTGEQDPAPVTECWETAIFNDVTCSWDVTGEQAPAPETECWETATFNEITCSWDVIGVQNPAPDTECWETAAFNDETCMWEVSGEQPLEPDSECGGMAAFNHETCMWEFSGDFSTSISSPQDENDGEADEVVMIYFGSASVLNALDVTNFADLISALDTDCLDSISYQWQFQNLGENTEPSGNEVDWINVATSENFTVNAFGDNDFHHAYRLVITNTAGVTATSNYIRVYSIDTRCKNPNKVKVCMVPNGNPDNAHEICVSQNAVDAILENSPGSFVGACDPEFKLITDQTPDIEVYPNPTRSELNINYRPNIKEHTRIELYSSTGQLMKLVFDGMTEAELYHNEKVEMTNYEDGIYLIRIIDSNGVYTKRVIFTK